MLVHHKVTKAVYHHFFLPLGIKQHPKVTPSPHPSGHDVSAHKASLSVYHQYLFSLGYNKVPSSIATPPTA